MAEMAMGPEIRLLEPTPIPLVIAFALSPFAAALAFTRFQVARAAPGGIWAARGYRG